MLVDDFRDARQIIHMYHFQNIREGSDCGSEIGYFVPVYVRHVTDISVTAESKN